MTVPAASIVIPVHNRAEELAHVLAQLAVQRRNDFELIVVDDGSDPPLTPELPQGGAPVPMRIVRHERRCGVGKARNTGVAAARADLVVFVDSDGDIADPDWFGRHMALHREAAAMAERSGKLLYVLHSEVRGISRSFWGRTDTYSNWFGSAMTRPCAVLDRHVPTHNTSVRKQVFEQAGLFDESLEVCEDVEWSFRCLEKGVGLFFIPGAPIGHFDRSGFREVWRHYQRFGRFARRVREKRAHAAYQWLFPRGSVSAALLFFPLTGLMTAYIVGCWLPRDPRVLLYLPGLYIANVAYYAGIWQDLRETREQAENRESK